MPEHPPEAGRPTSWMGTYTYPVGRTGAARSAGAEWPCPTAQADLLAGYRDMKISLSLLLASQWVDCLTDLYVLHPSTGEAPSLPGLYERFFGWADLGARR